MAAVQKPPLGIRLHPVESTSLVFVSTCKLEERPPPPLKSGMFGRAASFTQRSATARRLDRRLSGRVDTSSSENVVPDASNSNLYAKGEGSVVQVEFSAPHVPSVLPQPATSFSNAPLTPMASGDQPFCTPKSTGAHPVIQKEPSYLRSRKSKNQSSPSKRQLSSKPKPKPKPKNTALPKQLPATNTTTTRLPGDKSLSSKPWTRCVCQSSTAALPICPGKFAFSLSSTQLDASAGRSKSMQLTQTAPARIIQPGSASVILQSSPISVLSPASSSSAQSSRTSLSGTPPENQPRDRVAASEASAPCSPMEPVVLQQVGDADKQLPTEPLPALEVPPPACPSELSSPPVKQRSSMTGCPARVVAHLKGTKIRQDSKPLAKSWPRNSSPVKKRPEELSPYCPPRRERSFDPEEAARKAAARLQIHKRLRQEQKQQAEQEEASRREKAKELRRHTQSERNSRRQRIYALNAILTKNEWANIQIIMKQMQVLEQGGAAAEDAAEMIAAVATNSV